jgi:nitric oxide reductase subunit B
MPNGKSIWPAVILAATILVYVAYALMAYYTFTQHLYAETSLYGVNLLSILPYNVARALH